MRIPLEVMRRLLTPQPVSEAPAPTQPATPPPPADKSFNGWVDGISTHWSGVTVMLNRNADGSGGGTDKIWLLMSDTPGKLVDTALVPYLEEFKRAQSNRLYVSVIYSELPYRNLVSSVFVFNTPLYTKPFSELPPAL